MKNYLKYFVPFIVLISVSSIFLSCMKKMTNPETLAEEMAVAQNAVNLGQNTLNTITSIDPSGKIVFSQNSDDLQTLQAGNIIVSGPLTATDAVPNGFLKRVESKNVVGATVELTTSDANLEDVFESVTIDTQITLTAYDLEQGNATSGEISYFVDNMVLYDADGDLGTATDQIVANGNIDISPGFVFKLTIQNSKLIEFKFVNISDLETMLEINSGIGLTYENTSTLTTLSFKPITLMADWISIVLKPVLTINIGVDVQASDGFNMQATQYASVQAEFEYKNNNWTSNASAVVTHNHIDPTVTGNVNARGSVEPMFQLLLYGVSGPYTTLLEYLELITDVFQSPWWRFYGGLEVSAGINTLYLGDISNYPLSNVVTFVDTIAEASNVLNGTLTGSVRDAVTEDPLSDVLVTVKKDGLEIAQGMTDASGIYSLEIPVYDNYIVEFTFSGYITVIYENVSVASGGTTYLEPILQINEIYAGTGSVEGIITNALSGSPVEGILLEIRAGVNKRNGVDPLTSTFSNADGTYAFIDLNAGNYTVEASGNGFNTTYFTVLCIGGQTISGQNAAITPLLESNEVRIVLTWGDTPNDLDSHLTGPTPEGDRFHTWWLEKVYSYDDPNPDIPAERYVELDLDDLTSYGPETTTIYTQVDGTYRFSVHDYSNRFAEESFALANSGAQVRIYKGSDLLETFYAPTNMGGTLWTVFEMYGNTIVHKNLMSYVSSGSAITKTTDETDSELFRNLPEK